MITSGSFWLGNLEGKALANIAIPLPNIALPLPGVFFKKKFTWICKQFKLK